MGLLCVKLVFLVVTLLVFLVGIALVGVGVWIRADPNFFAVLALATQVHREPLFTAATVLVICIGVVLTFVSVFACCGALNASRCMIRAYIVILIVVTLAQVIASVFAGLTEKTLSVHFGESIRDRLKLEDFYGPKGPGEPQPRLVGQLMNIVQQKYHCCGINNYTDYRHAENGYNNITTIIAASNSSWTAQFPFSCCELKEGARQRKPLLLDVHNVTNCEELLSSDFYSVGCSASLTKEMDFHARILLAICLIALCLEVLSIFLGVCLWRAITKDYYY